MTDTEGVLDRLLLQLQKHHSLPTIALGLDRVLACLDRLGNPQLRLPPVVHIAGTNGKGSTLAMLRALLEGNGKRVHCYTSPHLVRFHERVVLCGQQVQSEQLLDALMRVQAAAGDDVPLTFFETTTIAALLCFAEVPADVVLLEVGLGGRLDATNVVPRPLACVITPIDIDHQEFLGNTLHAIALEKAGIMKPGVPVIIAEQYSEVEALLVAHSKSLHCPTILARHASEQDVTLSLVGAHQRINAACAMAALRVIAKTIGIKNMDGSALSLAVWPGRLQRLTRGPLLDIAGCAIWLDGGHNPAAAKVLAEWWATQIGHGGLVVGMMVRKDSEGFLRCFRAFDMPVATVTIQGDGEAASAENIATIADSLGFSQVHACDSYEEAVRWHTVASVAPISRILLCGSLYLAGKVLQNHA